MGVRLRVATAAAILVALFATAWFLAPAGGALADMLRPWQRAIAGWSEAWPVSAALVFVLATAAGKLTPFPGGAILMLSGGFLFGALTGGLLAAAGSALSAGSVLILGRRLLGGMAERRLGGRFAAIERRMAADGFNYLLALRLLPVLPAWLVNLLPLAVPVPLPTVLLATFLGVLPISLIVAGIGSGLSDLAGAGAFSMELLLRADILLPLAALAGFALLPALLRRKAGC